MARLPPSPWGQGMVLSAGKALAARPSPALWARREPGRLSQTAHPGRISRHLRRVQTGQFGRNASVRDVTFSAARSCSCAAADLR
jgi:hypothetical protein